MSLAATRKVEDVLARYPVKARRIRLLSDKGKKAVWRVTTDEGDRMVKKVPFGDRDIEFMIAAIAHLRENGLFTPAVIRTSDGEGWARLDDERYVVFEAVSGRPPEYKRKEELRAIMRGMATLHKASRGFAPPPGCAVPSKTASWEKEKRGRLGRLEALKAEASSALAEAKAGAFDKLFLRHADVILAMGEQAIEALLDSGFDRWAEEAARWNQLCHQDFAAGNLALGDGGRLYVFDMDSLTVDAPSRDIRKILNKVMKRDQAWDLERLVFMLKSYQEVNPLTRWQMEALVAELTFPHLAYGQVSKYYEGREPEWPESKHLQRLRAMMATERSKVEVLRAFRERIGEVLAHGGGVKNACSEKGG